MERSWTRFGGVFVASRLISRQVGTDPTEVLVISQVVLSFCVPFALVPLVLLTRQPDLMGRWVNRGRTWVAAAGAAAVIIALNGVVIFLAIHH